MHNQSIRRIPALLSLAALAALVFASQAGAMVLPERSKAPASEDSNVVPGHYIVVLKDSVKGPAVVAKAQVSQRDGELGFVYRHALKGYSAELSTADAEALRKDPRVKRISPVRKVEIASQTIPTGIERIYATVNKAIDIDEEDDARIDVDVAVIDTGIDELHPDLNVAGGTNCVPPKKLEEPNAKNCAGSTGTDDHGHGTHVAGTVGAIDNGYGVVGVAPGARLWAVKVLTPYIFGSATGYEPWIIAGIDWVTATRTDEDPENDIEVANMSLGCPCSLPAVEEAISNSVEAGIVYVVAAGNDEIDVKEFSPAKSPDVIAVSALADYDGLPGNKAEPPQSGCSSFSEDDGLASFSNYGEGVDVAAPGVCIYSTTRTVGWGYNFNSGTSMAAPHVAGAAALLASESKPESQEDVEAIRATIEAEGRAGEEAGLATWTDSSGDGVQEPLLYLGGENGQLEPDPVFPFAFAFGEEGTGEGQLKSPGGVAIDSVGNLWVADSANDRIQKFNPEGKYLSQFGKTGSGNGQLDRPVDVAVDSKGNLWVADADNYRVQKFSPEGEYLDQFGSQGSEEGQLDYPAAIAIDFKGNLWVADANNHRIQKFDSEGKFVVALGEEGSEPPFQFGSPVGMATDPQGNIVVLDSANSRVFRFEPPGGYPLAWFGKKGSSAGKLNSPTALDVDSDGNIWIADGNRAQKFNANGDYLGQVGSEGSGEGELNSPTGIAIDSEDSVWVSDSGNHRLQKWLAISMPTISSTSASAVTASAAKVQASVNPKGYETTYQFEYGTTTAYGSKVPASPESVGSGKATVEVSEALSGLKPSTIYHFRVVAASAKGTVQSKDRTFTTGKPLPEVQTEAANTIGETEATLNASVDANGLATTYQFEYGTTTAYGSKAPASPKEAGSGLEPVKVAEKLTGLKPSTTYHFRVTATNAEGTAKGANGTFKTPPLFPAANTLKAADLTMSSATLRAEIDPEGLETTYQFEYGTSTAYGNVVPASPKIAGSGSSWVEVSEPIGGLKAGTTYFFRVVATNKDGKVSGKSQSFKTFSIEAPDLAFAFGSQGSGNGQFQYPSGIAIDKVGNAWVVDSWNHRVQKFDSEGKYLAQFGSGGSGNGQLYHPTGIAIDASGNIWVTDTANRVQKFDSEGKYLTQFGGSGSGNGQLHEPAGIAIDKAGNVWVLDSGDYPVQKFDSEGKYLSQFGEWGEGQGQFYGPAALAIDEEGDIWVADTYNYRVQEFSPTGEYLSSFGEWGEAGEGQFMFPSGIAFDAEGNLWVTDYASGRVEAFSPEGQHLSTFGPKAGSSESPYGFSPLGIAADAEGDLWITESGYYEVQKWEFPALPKPTATTEAATEVSGQEATLNASVNPNGQATTYQFEYGTTTAYGSKAPASPKAIGEGALALEASEKLSGLKEATTYHFRIVATNEYGTTKGKDETLTTLPLPTATTKAATAVSSDGATLNASVNPNGLATAYQFEYGTTTAYGSKAPLSAKSVGSGTESVAVSEPITGLKPSTTYHYRIVATSAAGTSKGLDGTFTTLFEPPSFTFAFGSYGSGNGQLNNPSGIAIDKAGSAWVVDSWNHRVQKFDSEGKYLAQFGSGGSGNGQLYHPTGIAIDASGNLWVTDTANNRVQKFSSEGKYLSQFGGSGSGNGQLHEPAGIAIDKAGNVWVLDSGDYPVQKFNSEGKYLSQFGEWGEGEGQFYGPAALAIDEEGDIWVADTYNYRVQEFSPTGEYLSQFGEYGEEEDQFYGPGGIAFDAAGNLWVTDYYLGYVKAFTPEGQYLGRFGAKAGSEESLFSMPFGIAVDAEGNFWVTDVGYVEVQKWEF